VGGLVHRADDKVLTEVAEVAFGGGGEKGLMRGMRSSGHGKRALRDDCSFPGLESFLGFIWV